MLYAKSLLDLIFDATAIRCQRRLLGVAGFAFCEKRPKHSG
jgi:hypothetical protein